MRTSSGLRLLVLVTVLAGCGGPATPSPSPASTTTVAVSPAPATPQTTEGPTAAPTEEPVEPTDQPEPDGTEPASASLWAQDPPTPLLMNTAVRVIVDELNVRARPDTSARREGLVLKNWILAVSPQPPVEADGYTWYQGRFVASTGEPPALPTSMLAEGAPVSGYFAAFKGSIPYVARIESRCPSTLDLHSITAMLPAERLACFDDRSIEIEGTYGCPGTCISHIFGEYEPDWLLNPNASTYIWEGPAEGFPLLLRFPPSISNPGEGLTGHVLRVTGHFRDAAAPTCSMAMDYWWDDGIDSHTVPDVVARLLCRQEFVVGSYEDLGPDPNWPG